MLFLKHPLNFSLLVPYAELLDENAYPILSKNLPTIEYEKIFHLFLLTSLKDKTAFRKELKKTIARKIERVNAFLDGLFAEK